MPMDVKGKDCTFPWGVRKVREMCDDIREMAVTGSVQQEGQKLEMALKGKKFASLKHNTELIIFIIKYINKAVRRVIVLYFK